MFCVCSAAGNRKVAFVWYGLDVCEPQCSGFVFAITHSVSTVQTVHDEFQQVGMRPVGFPHTFAVAEFTVSAAKFSLSLSELVAFVIYGMRVCQSHLMYFVIPKSICLLLRIKLHVFMLLMLFYVLLPIFHKFWKQISF